MAIIQSDKIFVNDSSPVENKFVNQFSKDNNLIILTENKVDDLYATPIFPNLENLSINSHHFSSIKDMFY